MEQLPAFENLHLPQTSIDIVGTQEFLNFFAECIEVKGPILVFQLFYCVATKFPQEQWSKLFKTPNDLTTFLRIFSDCFQIQSNLVTLLKKPELSDSHILQLAQDKSQEQYNATNNNTNRNNTNDHQQQLVNHPTTFEFSVLREPVINEMTNTCWDNERNVILTTDFADLAVLQQQLVNTPPNSSKLQINTNYNCGISATDPVSNLNCATTIHSYNKNIPNNNGFDSYASPTVDFNMENLCEHNCPSLENLTVNSGGEQVTTSIQNNTTANNDAWKIGILQNTRIISTIKEATFIIDRILNFAENVKQVVVSVDCEGINLGVKGKVTLIDVGTTKGDAFIFDILACPEMVIDGGLKKLLEHSNVIKIIHDCRNDSINLYQQFGILLRNVFDTQAAHTVLQFQNNHEKFYKVKCISLNSICKIYNAPINPMKDRLKKVYWRDQAYWAKRPLTRDMLTYAACDVLVLINEQLYGNMSRLLKPEYKQLFSELCTKQILMLIKANEVKIPQCKITTEVSDKQTRVTKKLENIKAAGSLQNRECIHSDHDGIVNEIDKITISDSVTPDNLLTFSRRNSDIGGGIKDVTTKKSQASQTLSTGKIRIMKVHFDDEENKAQEKI